MLFLYNIDVHEGRVFLYVAAFVSVLLIFIFSPIENKNKPLTVVEYRKFGIISKIIAVILTAVMCVSLLLNINILFYSSSYALTADAVLIVLSLKEVKHNEYDS